MSDQCKTSSNYPVLSESLEDGSFDGSKEDINVFDEKILLEQSLVKHKVDTAKALFLLSIQSKEYLINHASSNDEEVERWKNDPLPIFSDFRLISEEMASVWRNHWDNHDDICRKLKSFRRKHVDKEFGKVYMNLVTEAFGETLDKIRQGHDDLDSKSKNEQLEGLERYENVFIEPNLLKESQQEGLDVEILVDCLQSGIDHWIDEERELLVHTSRGQKIKEQTLRDEEENMSFLTPHEENRRRLFGET